MISDIPRCPSCGLRVIAEEVPIHQCRRKVTDYKIEGNILWLYDGANWYPRKLLSVSRSSTATHFSTPKHDTPEDDRTIIIIIMIAEAAISVSMRIKMARPWSNAEKKPEKYTTTLRRNFEER